MFDLAKSLFDPRGHGQDVNHRAYIVPSDDDRDDEMDLTKRRLPVHLALMPERLLDREPFGLESEALLEHDDPPYEYRKFFVGSMPQDFGKDNSSVVLKGEGHSSRSAPRCRPGDEGTSGSSVTTSSKANAASEQSDVPDHANDDSGNIGNDDQSEVDSNTGPSVTSNSGQQAAAEASPAPPQGAPQPVRYPSTAGVKVPIGAPQATPQPADWDRYHTAAPATPAWNNTVAPVTPAWPVNTTSEARIVWQTPLAGL
jgi:hypothetical protein